MRDTGFRHVHVGHRRDSGLCRRFASAFL